MSSIPDLKKAKIRSISHEGALHKSQLDIMNEKLSNLSQNLGSLKGKYNRLNKDRDSLKNHLDYFWPMRSLMHNKFDPSVRIHVLCTKNIRPIRFFLIMTDFVLIEFKNNN
jgi:hypothetical protein